ncbi:MAG: NAD(P)/FAD-dependent oxidoreductase [Acidobacteria bacterium]|nr:NAD(P)/FAD-dependent oxidoreductase [Acidobacteriota bacterium]MCL5288145.1 NAD(P)/FAD-dependent oxidoreductase [Acidobacteriota bacterium]
MNPGSADGKSVVIIGGGPAGLTASYELSKHGVPAVVLEADNIVGGISRTVNYKGYLFDIGGHRFFSKCAEVNQIWEEILHGQFLERPRLSRIYYRNKFFYYPLKPKNALFGLGLFEAMRIVASYAWSRVNPHPKEDNLEEWVSNRFGKRLYEIFFKTYTEKVWGVPCTEIRAEWAAQRIRGLSLTTAIKNALFGQKKPKVKTLIDKFHYPERGPGQMWETLTDMLRERGYPVLMERPVVRIAHDGTKVTHLVTRGAKGEEKFAGTHFISSMPIRELVNALDPPAPPAVHKAANSLRYRDFLIVSLIVNRKDIAPDNWIYIHESKVKVGRIQNFKNWSPAMVPDPSKTCLGMEYFVFENDELWSSPDDKLIEMAKREIEQLGLAKASEIEDGCVVRMPKAYPMYDADWHQQVQLIRHWIETNLPNLQMVGRNGMHKYNNQDHSMMTALYAARNILGENHDLWSVNTDEEYHEEAKAAPATVDAEPKRPAYAEPPRVPKSGASEFSGAKSAAASASAALTDPQSTK